MEHRSGHLRTNDVKIGSQSLGGTQRGDEGSGKGRRASQDSNPSTGSGSQTHSHSKRSSAAVPQAATGLEWGFAKQQVMNTAVQKGDVAKVQKLLEEGGVSLRGYPRHEGKQRNYLEIAVREGYVHLVQWLLKQEGVVIPHGRGFELYCHAQERGQINVVKSLLEARVPPPENEMEGKDFVKWVLVNQERYDLIPLLQDGGFDVGAAFSCPNDGLCEYFYHSGNTKGFKALVDAGYYLDFLHDRTDKRGSALRAWALA